MFYLYEAAASARQSNRVGVVIRQLWLGAILLLAGLVGCSSSERVVTEPLKLFETRGQAIQEYEHSEPMASWTVIQLNIGQGPKLLITKHSTEVYSAAQIVEKDRQFWAAKLTADVDITEGGGFKCEMNTLDGKTYTLSVSKDKDAQGTWIKELGAAVIVQEGRHLRDNPGTAPVNLVDSYELVP